MGAGAVGCYYGALLALAGHQVVLVGRSALCEAVAANGGLLLERQGRSLLAPVAATTDPACIADADIVLFCVKSGDTEAAGRTMAPFLRPDCAVLSLQNGVGNAERLSAVTGRAVTACVVYVAADMAAPGQVRHHGRGELVLAASARAEATASLLNAAGIETQLSDDVAAALWSKLILNCAYNAISAITQRPYGELVRGENVPELIEAVLAECLAVAQGAGIVITDDLRQAAAQVARTMPGQLSSTAQDLARGRRSEIDYLNGHVVREGRRLGIPTPANTALHALVRLLEAR